MEKVTIDYNRLCLELEKQGKSAFRRLASPLALPPFDVIIRSSSVVR